MKKYLGGAALILICGLDVLPAYGQEIIVDIGTFSCTPAAYSSPSNTRRPQSMELTAKIYIDPSNESTKNTARSCAERAKRELGDYDSSSNIQLLKETFQRYLEVCTRAESGQIRSVRSILVAGRCR